jgi:succinate dehydrogenase / fumarate reductase flavoprotein subunit/fumarate reductase flavoprotein subunit
VAGEDSGGAHGANRLGGNGVAESTVYGAIAGDVAAAEAPEVGVSRLDPDHVAEIERRALRPLDGSGDEDPFEVRTELENVMWEHVGLVRHQTGMSHALHVITELRERSMDTCVPNFRKLNLAWTEALDLQNLLQVAELVTRSAIARRESRGAHYRSDFPETDNDHWLRNIHLRRASDASVQLWDEPVRFTHLIPPGVASAVAV